MGYYILQRTVHTAQGQGMGTGKFTMGFLLIFQDLKYFPVVLCNGFQLHAYFQVSFPVPVPVQCEHCTPFLFPVPVPVTVTVPFLCSVNVPLDLRPIYTELNQKWKFSLMSANCFFGRFHFSLIFFAFASNFVRYEHAFRW